MRGEYIEEVLEWVEEDDFVVLPGVDGQVVRDGGFGGRGGWRGVCAGGGPGVEFEVVVEEDGFLGRFGDEVKADLDLKFTPAARWKKRRKLD